MQRPSLPATTIIASNQNGFAITKTIAVTRPMNSIVSNTSFGVPLQYLKVLCAVIGEIIFELSQVNAMWMNSAARRGGVFRKTGCVITGQTALTSVMKSLSYVSNTERGRLLSFLQQLESTLNPQCNSDNFVLEDIVEEVPKVNNQNLFTM